MRIVGLPRGFYCVSRNRPIELSPKAHDRLRWLRAWHRLRQQGFFSDEAFAQWERIYNTIRPDQSLDQKTPAEYLRQHTSGLAPPWSPLGNILI